MSEADLPRILDTYLAARAARREALARHERDLTIIEASLCDLAKHEAGVAAEADLDRAAIDFFAAEKALLGASLRAVLARQDRLTSIVKIGTSYCVIVEECDARVGPSKADLYLAVVAEDEVISIPSKGADA